MSSHFLQPYAVAFAEGRRTHAEESPETPDRCFQIDQERILRCSAFRRLDFKTQVFVPHEHDHFRTRLTHTLEVDQVGRRLGRSLGLNEDLIEAVALAHDLGHPPFGHVGETVLDDLMAEHGNFEHNRQSLRIVDYLEHPYPHFRGLNLTRPTRECIARHETRYDAPACSEFPPGARAPLEGQIVDQADEIAYTAADLEDALAAGWIDGRSLHALELWQRAWRRAQQYFPDARLIHKRIHAVRSVLEILCEDLLQATSEAIDAAGVGSSEAVRRAPERFAGLSKGLRGELDQMQAFLLENVYRHPNIAQRDDDARRMLTDLFTTFTRSPETLPERYRRRVEAGEDGLPRVACDYIAGMTDRFCRTEHQRLCG